MTRIAPKPSLQAAVADTVQPSRAQIAHDLFTSQLTITPDLAPHARDLIWAAGTTRDGPDTEGLVPPAAGFLALRALSSLTPAVRAAVEGIVSAAGTPGERAVLLKTVGANAAMADNLPGALRDVAEAIHGDDVSTLVRKTTAYDLRDVPGIRQSLPISCGPAMLLTMNAELNPLMALRLGADAALGPSLESRMLEHHGVTPTGFAVETVDATLNAIFNTHGITYVASPWWNLAPAKKTQLLDQLFPLVQTGGDVAILLHDGTDGHYATLVDATLRQGQRTWCIQDPDRGMLHLNDNAFLNDGLDGAMRVAIIWTPA